MDKNTFFKRSLWERIIQFTQKEKVNKENKHGLRDYYGPSSE